MHFGKFYERINVPPLSEIPPLLAFYWWDFDQMFIDSTSEDFALALLVELAFEAPSIPKVANLLEPK